MSWLLAKLSGKSDNILHENTPVHNPTPALYPSIPQPEPVSLPYDIIRPTPSIPSSPSHSTDVLPNSLDAMKVKFKFLYDSNMEDMELSQLLALVERSRQTSRKLEQFISEIDRVDFDLERSVVSSS